MVYKASSGAVLEVKELRSTTGNPVYVIMRQSVDSKSWQIFSKKRSYSKETMQRYLSKIASSNGYSLCESLDFRRQI